VILLRNRLKYALTRREVVMILQNRLVKVDGKARTDYTYPAGFQDVITIDKTGEHFRLLYDVKGRFTLQPIDKNEAQFKLCKVKRQSVGAGGIPYIVTHDGRTIRYADPDIKVHDTVKLDLATNKPVEHVKFDVGNVVMITGGRNVGRVGVITNREKHAGSFDIVHVKDVSGNTFATRLGNVFIIGKGTKSWVTLPRGNGVKASAVEDRERRLAKQAGAAA